MKPPKPTDKKDCRGRTLYQKWCSDCGKESLVRLENTLDKCTSCGKAKGKGFPDGVQVDAEFQYLSRYSWSLNNSGYVKGPGGELHRIIMQAERGQEIHHINHNKLDCRKENLCFVTHSENLQLYWDKKKGRV